MARSWSTSTVIVVLIAGIIASSQGKSKGRSENSNSNTNINTNDIGRRSNGNTNMFERRVMDQFRDAGVDLHAKDKELTVPNFGEDDTSATTLAPLTSTTASVAAITSLTKKSKKMSKSGTMRRKLAQDRVNEARRSTNSEILDKIYTLCAKNLGEETAKVIVNAIRGVLNEKKKTVKKSNRSTRRNYNMNSNTNTFGMKKPQKKLGGEKLGKLKRRQLTINPETFLPQIMDAPPVPGDEEADDSEEDISDSVETNSNINTNINSNTNQFGNDPDDDQLAESWDFNDGFEHHRRRRPVSAARAVTPDANSASLEEMHRVHDPASALRAAEADSARFSENYNSNSNINEFRRVAPRNGLKPRTRKRDRSYPDDDEREDRIRRMNGGGNVDSNTNMNMFRRSGNHNVNSNTNYADRRE